MNKKAELALSDADKFPKESLREKLSKRFGLDAVALSGPCEGQPIAECVVAQLEKRWDRVKQKLGSMDKVTKLANKMAESYMSKDDTQDCVKDLKALGFKEAAAGGIASYLKAYAIDDAAELDFNKGMDEVATEAPMGGEPPMDDVPPADPMGEEAPMGGEEPPMEESMGGEPPLGGEEPPMGGDLGGEETVTVELPKDLVQQLGEALEVAGGEGGAGEGMVEGPPEGLDMGDAGDEMPEGGAPDLGGLEIEVVEDPMGGEMGGATDEVVPGEPGEEMDEHKVEGGCACGGAGCAACGGGQKSVASEGPPMAEEKCTCGKDVCPKCGKPKEEEKKEFDAGVKEEKKEVSEGKPAEEGEKHEEKESPAFEKGEESVEKEEGGEKKENPFKKEEKKPQVAEASAKKSVKTAEEIARLGNEMKLNSTDQIGPHKGKELGTAKDKAVEAPKPVSEGNLETEGYSAGDKKFQDKATMGHEQKFDAKEVDKGSVTGGESSIMGKDESFPKGGPSVPAGSSPIGGEQFQGGDVSTKGTIIAEITPKGVVVKADGKQKLAAAKITQKMLPAVKAGLAKIAFVTMDSYIAAITKVLVEAEKSGTVDNVTKTDTSKLEGSTFTNDGEKKPDEGGAKTSKGKAVDQDKGITKTDTSKKEANDFQNDAEKKPEGEKKAETKAEVKEAAKAEPAKVEVKTAKPVEAPKPIADGNLETEGYSAGDKKFQNNGTLGHEQKFDAKEVDKGSVSKGSASEMGKDESFPTGKPDVPAGGGKMGNEVFDGGNVATKGTIIAETQKREVSEEKGKLAEAKVREERLKAAAVYTAELLAQGEITTEEYTKELEKAASLPVPAIQAMIVNVRKARARITAKVAASQQQGETKVGLSIPVVITASNNETSLVERLVKEFKLTKQLDDIDTMPTRQ
jgi:hypothetical protein